MNKTKLKSLKDLTLLDKFLFDETMDHPEVHEAVLQIILGNDNLRLLAPTQTEKELRPAPWLKNIAWMCMPWMRRSRYTTLG